MDGMQWMASAMRSARTQLETATHNLANVGSDAFRRVRSTLVLTENGLVAHEAASSEQGGVRETGRRFDLALLGAGAFVLDGGRTRDGAFTRTSAGELVDARGRRLHGSRGPITVSPEATIEPDGTVRDGGRAIERLPLPTGTSLRSGALETSNADTIGETLAMLDAQRAFETAQKTFAAIDETRRKAVDDVGRLR